MRFLEKLFGKKSLDKNCSTKYQIDINPNSDIYSQEFKDFYSNHFINAIGLCRGEVDLSFFEKMTSEEKIIAKRLIRQNLELREAHLIKASGLLKDEEALPILYEQYKSNSDLSWLLTIGQAIWRINDDQLYQSLLRKLPKHSSENMKVAHFEQITDLKNSESIEMLFDFLEDESKLVQSMAISKLNYLETGKYSFEPENGKQYYLEKRMNNEFANKLLMNLKKLNK